MLPSIELRLKNLEKALLEVIIPALPASEALARDQAMLVVAHLRMIGLQWKSAPRFAAGSVEELCGLARKLLAEATAEQAVRIRAALDRAEAVRRDDLDALEAASLALGQTLDPVIAGAPNTPASTALTRAVLDYGARQARRERSWFQSNNLDPDRAELPSIEAMLAGEI